MPKQRLKILQAETKTQHSQEKKKKKRSTPENRVAGPAGTYHYVQGKEQDFIETDIFLPSPHMFRGEFEQIGGKVGKANAKVVWLGLMV